MTKKELAELVLSRDELANIDYTPPQNFVDDCENLLGIDVRPYYVWDYSKNKIGGQPLNLAERFFMAMQSAPDLLKAVGEVLIQEELKGEPSAFHKVLRLHYDHMIDLIAYARLSNTVLDRPEESG